VGGGRGRSLVVLTLKVDHKLFEVGQAWPRQSGILSIKSLYRPSRPVKGIALLLNINTEQDALFQVFMNIPLNESVKRPLVMQGYISYS
jgi:hypothetical protein